MKVENGQQRLLPSTDHRKRRHSRLRIFQLSDRHFRYTLAYFALIATFPATAQVREDPYKTLQRAERLFWLDNWVKARPLYARCEREFRQRGDIKNELLARF